MFYVQREEIESEDHLARLAHGETERLQKTLRRLRTEAEELESEINRFENRGFVFKTQSEDVQRAIDDQQEELDKWVLAAQQKEEDNTALER